jgi:DNA polymerase (family 10)
MLQAEVAQALNEIADFHDVLGDKFRPRAYRRAARAVENSSADLMKLMELGELISIPGVGENIAGKIEEFIQTGRISHVEKLRAKIPPGVAELLKIPDVGPRTAMTLHQELNVSSIEDLEAAIAEERLRAIKGMGEKTEQNILRGIELLRRGSGRVLLGRALPIANTVKEHLKDLPSVERISLAGSLRRMKESVGDLDVLVTTKAPSEVIGAFVSMPMVRDVLARGETKSSVLLGEGLQVDLRVVPDSCFGAALQYFTGSKDHNIKLREIAQRRDLKLSEYGLFDANGKRVAGESETEIYEHLGMPYVEPELRENTGEIEAALEGRLPRLVSREDILGDLHVHSDWSDGRQGIGTIAERARELGHDFVCITDHSKTLQIAHGLSEDDILRQIEEIRSINAELGGSPVVLSGLEVDIRNDGSLDTPSGILSKLDLVVGSIHSGFKSDRKSMTRRLVGAISSGDLHVLGHPTGRILDKREPYPFDEEEVFGAAAEHGVAMEINAFPDRLDLNDRLARRAAELGIKIAIGTDSHDVDQMRYIEFGLSVARRAWLGPGDILNCLPASKLLSALRP